MTINAPWPAIRLSVTQCGNEVVFAITFVNATDQPQQLLFSNLSRKAELAGLRIKDATGSRVEPDRKFIGRPAAFAEPGRWLQPVEAWTYELSGELANGSLDFPSVLYHLTPGQVYHVQFVYQHVLSNQVELVP